MGVGGSAACPDHVAAGILLCKRVNVGSTLFAASIRRKGRDVVTRTTTNRRLGVKE